MAVTAAGSYASLHLAPDRTMPAPYYSFFTGRMPFLLPKQQRQSTEAKAIVLIVGKPPFALIPYLQYSFCLLLIVFYSILNSFQYCPVSPCNSCYAYPVCTLLFFLFYQANSRFHCCGCVCTFMCITCSNYVEDDCVALDY